MAFEKLNAFTKDVSDLSDKPSLNPTELKAQFDAAPDEVRTYLNKLIDALKKTTAGDSGAKNIGASTVTGLSGTDVQTILASMKTYMDNNFLLGGGSGMRFERCQAVFFTNGGSSDAQYNVTFSKAFTNIPTIVPGDISVEQSYADVIRYPFVFNQSKTGFSVKITTGDTSKLGTSGSPANIFMNFIAIGN